MLNDYVNNDGTKLNADDILAVWTLYWGFFRQALLYHCRTTYVRCSFACGRTTNL